MKKLMSQLLNFLVGAFSSCILLQNCSAVHVNPISSNNIAKLPKTHDTRHLPNQNVCTTPSCVITAAELLRNLDREVDPCDDFYQYACGNWMGSFRLEGSDDLTPFTIAQDNLDKNLQENLVEGGFSGIDKPVIGIMKSYYNSCINDIDLTKKKMDRSSRMKHCLSVIKSDLLGPLVSIYVKKKFDERKKNGTDRMAAYVKRGFLKVLDEADWLDLEAKNRARMEVQAVDCMTGYPIRLLNDTLFEESYNGVRISEYSNFSVNWDNIWSLKLSKPFYGFYSPEDDFFFPKVLTTNAYNVPLYSRIYIPAGIMQGWFYDETRPKYINFGSLGSIIGHEMTHGFDPKYTLSRSNFSALEFQKRSQCLIDQYSNCIEPVTKLKVDGERTLEENIADQVGIKAAYKGYNLWSNENGEESTLPALNLTSRQLFWLSAANNWCGKFSTETLRDRLVNASHSPERFRVKTAFSNIREFIRDFNCPVNSRMNPTIKCSIL